MTGMNIQVSGSVLASLFYEHSTNENDLEGFLLGEISSKQTDTISDTQITNIKEETTCNIYSYVVCRKAMMFYTNNGAVVTDKLKSLLSEGKHKEVVGWYKFRRNSTLTPSLRERSIHGNLLDCFPGVVAGNFLYLLCTSSQTTNQSTHTMDHVFQVVNNSKFQSLPVKVINLGDSVSQYKSQANTMACHDGQFTKTINSYKSAFMNRQGESSTVSTINEMNQALQKQLKSMCGSVTESEREIDQLRLKVKRLKAQLRPARKQSPARKIDGNPFREVTRTDSVPSSLPPTNNYYSALPRKPDDSPLPATSDVTPAHHTENNPFIATAQTLAPPEVDLISFGDSDEESRSAALSNVDTVPSSFLETMDVTEHSPQPPTNKKVDWNKNSNSNTEGGFDFVDDLLKDSVKGKGRRSPRTPRATRSTKPTSRPLEAIEMSSDEDPSLLSASPVF